MRASPGGDDLFEVPGAASETAGCVDFGGLAVRVRCSDSRWQELAWQRYAAFQTTAAPALTVTYRTIGLELPGPSFLARARLEPPEVRRELSWLHLTGAFFEAHLDLETCHAEISGPLAVYPLDLFLRTAWPCLVKQSLIVHGAALERNGKGWLCSGPSGSGKSTLAELFPNEALCDELAAVRLGSAEVRVGALPFWRGRQGSARLCGIYVLRHGADNHRTRLSPAAALAELRRETVWPTFDSELLLRSFHILADLLERVPVWELSFRPERSVWDVLSQEA